MNVGDLKAILAEHDDDTPVLLRGHPHQDVQGARLTEVFAIGSAFNGYLTHLAQSYRDDTFDALIVD